MNPRWTWFAGPAALLLLLAGCGGDEMTSGTNQQQAGAAVTGLLLNGQTLEGSTVDLAHKSVTTWAVVDPSGTKIFGKEDIDPEFLRLKGVKYEWRREKALEGSSMWLGKNYREFPISVTLTGEKDNQTGVLKVTAGTAAEMRALPNLMKLVKHCNMVFLLGKMGQ